jgi:hypothetical protein
VFIVEQKEHLAGAGDVTFSVSGALLASNVNYSVIVVHPDVVERGYRRIEATIDLPSATATRVPLGERLTVTLTDGRRLDFLICGPCTERVDVLAIALRGRIPATSSEAAAGSVAA